MRDLAWRIRETFGWDFPLTTHLAYFGPQYDILGVVGADGTVIESDVDRRLEPALEEQGLTPLTLGSEPARDAAGRAMARAMLRGECTPRQLTADIHRIFGHNLESTDELAL